MIGHIYKDEKTGEFKEQSLEKHLQGTAERAGKFLSPLNLQHVGEVLGWLHDLGKAKPEFQNHIRSASGYDPSTRVSERVTHAATGAKYAAEKYRGFWDFFLVPPIIAHHTGLLDYACQEAGISREKTVPAFNLPQLPVLSKDTLPAFTDISQFHHFIRVLYSALVDADFLDTEAFMNKERSELRTSVTSSSLADLLSLLEVHMSKLQNNGADTPVNRIRKNIYKECLDKSTSDQGVYSLTVPTGGGKTLSSIMWALRHAVHHGLDRVIVAIPYTSIIIQTASIFRSIFGAKNVLEHHSNVELNGYNILASENWDAPIVVTTNVQLFESLYANKPSKCRKLHNIMRSVIILDEVQTLPSAFLQPIIDSLKAYHELFHVSLLLTSATQPSLEFKSSIRDRNLTGFKSIHEIISDPTALAHSLQRNDIHHIPGALAYEDIADKLMQHQCVLCIVNTRKDAQAIYNLMPQDGSTIHLSRMMCTKHIIEVIEQLKDRLQCSSEQPLRVIATQLIEAGVDIDFPVVYRAHAGLDSVLQAAGRCNREGKQVQNGQVYVFKLQENSSIGYIRAGQYALNDLDDRLPDANYFEPSTMKEYYHELYQRVDSFDKEKIKGDLESKQICFKKASDKFRLIDDTSTPILIKWGEGAILADEIKQGYLNRDQLRRLQHYTVSLRDKQLLELKNAGRIEFINDIWVQNDPELYDKQLGLNMDNHYLEETFIL